MGAHPRLAILLAGLAAPALLLTASPGAHAATPAPRATTAMVRVAIRGYAFAPKTVTVAPGTKVTWTNKDSDIHTVFSNTSAFMESNDLSTGKSFSHTFMKVGVYKYHCVQHAFMTGTVTVKSLKH